MSTLYSLSLYTILSHSLKRQNYFLALAIVSLISLSLALWSCLSLSPLSIVFFSLAHSLLVSLFASLSLCSSPPHIPISISLYLSQLVSPSSPFPPSLFASLSTLSSLFWFSLSLSTYLSLSLPSVILIICMLAHAAPQATQNNVSRKRPQMARHITLPNFNRQGTSDGYKYG